MSRKPASASAPKLKPNDERRGTATKAGNSGECGFYAGLICARIKDVGCEPTGGIRLPGETNRTAADNADAPGEPPAKEDRAMLDEQARVPVPILCFHMGASGDPSALQRRRDDTSLIRRLRSEDIGQGRVIREPKTFGSARDKVKRGKWSRGIC
jgi:hypothetical protein